MSPSVSAVSQHAPSPRQGGIDVAPFHSLYDLCSFSSTGSSWQGIPEATHNFQVTVPSSYAGGATRARAMMQEGGESPLDPCAKYTWGALIDFRVSTSGGGGGGSGSGGGLSGGSVFLIIILVVTVVYIAGGCFYNRKKKGTTGMVESCPNNQFWFILPGLVKDGCSFTNRKCVKPTIAKITGKSSGNHADYEEL